jgi:hypothetical protein
MRLVNIRGNQCLLILTTVLVTHCALAQSESRNKEIVPGKLYLIPLPALGYNPVSGFMFGVASSASISLGEPSNTRLSSGMFNALYTTNDQILISLKSTIYSREDKWQLMGDWRLFLSSQPTYGLSTGPQSEIFFNEIEEAFGLGDYKDGVQEGELMGFNLLRFHEIALYNVAGGFYAGIGYHLDKYWMIRDNILDLDADPPDISNHYAYSILHDFDPEEYTISGISLNALYDTRDNINSPQKGRYAFLQFKVLPTWMGSDKGATSLWIEYRDYFSLSKRVPRNILAFWTYFNLSTSGRFPYMGLPALGWDQFGRSGRAYPQGRFRGEELFYFESEYRFRLPILKKDPGRLGGVIFANATSASASDLNIDFFQYFKPGIGLGLRLTINEATRSNVCFDYGYGADGKGAFYFNLNEYF